MNNIHSILQKAKELLEKYQHIPFGNSIVQNLYLMVQDEYSNGRKLKSYLARLADRVQALEENYFKLKEEEIRLKKLHRQLEEETDELEKELIEVKIARSLSRLTYIKKLYADCIQEIATLVYAIEQLPYISREEFEKQELEHFKKRLIELTTKPDTIRGLECLGFQIEIDPIKQEFKIKETESIKNIVTKIEELKTITNTIYESVGNLPYINIKQLIFKDEKEEGQDANSLD